VKPHRSLLASRKHSRGGRFFGASAGKKHTLPGKFFGAVGRCSFGIGWAGRRALGPDQHDGHLGLRKPGPRRRDLKGAFLPFSQPWRCLSSGWGASAKPPLGKSGSTVALAWWPRQGEEPKVPEPLGAAGQGSPPWVPGADLYRGPHCRSAHGAKKRSLPQSTRYPPPQPRCKPYLLLELEAEIGPSFTKLSALVYTPLEKKSP
jgi:hypothetical protein